ncbi:MAG: menaquinone reductase multiheme cytochrome c subunit QrcA [Bacteroidota bacterium]
MKSKIMFIAGIVFGLLIGWYAFPFALYQSNEQPMQFSHVTHTGEKGGMACEDCHTTNENGRFQGIPMIAKCAECHSSALGETELEKQLVEQYITPIKEIPWLVYSRQPDNAFFSHAPHVTLGKMKCEECHDSHGTSASLRVHQLNRISGYSRDIWGANISGISLKKTIGMKMDKCVRCHDDRDRHDGCVACHK